MLFLRRGGLGRGGYAWEGLKRFSMRPRPKKVSKKHTWVGWVAAEGPLFRTKLTGRQKEGFNTLCKTSKFSIKSHVFPIS